jgi:hypothetical protein
VKGPVIYAESIYTKNLKLSHCHVSVKTNENLFFPDNLPKLGSAEWRSML